MPRVKRGNKRRDKRKKVLGLAKGYFLNKSKLYRAAKEAVARAGNFAYVGRRRSRLKCLGSGIMWHACRKVRGARRAS